jgi:hypothetical protein
MALDSYLVSRMCNWANWATRGADGGIGYRKQCTFYNAPQGEVKDYTPELNEGAIEIDACMKALSVYRLELYAVIYMHYVRNDLTMAGKLMALGCVKSTYYAKIDLAHNLILGFLNDLSCGIKLPN